MEKTAIFNIKGGVAKTTSTANFAACLSQENKKVLLIDIDPQSNLTKLFKAYNPDDTSIYNVLIEKDFDIHKSIKKTDFENIDIIPATIKLTYAEKQILIDNTRRQENRLEKALKKIEDEYDYCLIDCPPTLNLLITNVLCATDDVLVPIKIDKFALDGFEELVNTMFDMKEEFNPNLKLKGCFITMDSSTRVNKEIKEKLRRLLGDKLFHTTISQNVKVIESTFDECPVVFNNKKSKASLNYKELSSEIF